MLSVEDELNKRGLLKGVGHISRFVNSATIRAIGEQLIALHTPAAMDYAARFGMANLERPHAVSDRATAGPSQVAGSSSTPARPRRARPTCGQCGSERLTVQPGRFSFHFKCTACRKNTPIQIGCGKAGHRERIRQDGRTFYRECADCRTRSVFFVNPTAL